MHPFALLLSQHLLFFGLVLILMDPVAVTVSVGVPVTIAVHVTITIHIAVPIHGGFVCAVTVTILAGSQLQILLRLGLYR